MKKMEEKTVNMKKRTYRSNNQSLFPYSIIFRCCSIATSLCQREEAKYSSENIKVNKKLNQITLLKLCLFAQVCFI